MPMNRIRIKFSKIAFLNFLNMHQNVHVPGYTAHSQPTYDKFPQRSFGKTNPVKRSFQDSWFTNRTWLHCDEANDLTFCMVAYKDGKLNSNIKP